MGHCDLLTFSFFITARKRSLRRLCFYRCLSVHGGGFLHRGGSSIPGGVPPSRGGFLHPGGSSIPGGFSIRGGSPSKGGLSIQGGPPSRGEGVLHPVNVRAERILLECILVVLIISQSVANSDKIFGGSLSTVELIGNQNSCLSQPSFS